MRKRVLNYFSMEEQVLWTCSVLLIVFSFFVFDRENYMTLVASLIGVISYTFFYYGEMVTYLGMTMPMAVFALVEWLRNPYNGNKSEVKVNRISKTECEICFGGGMLWGIFCE